MAVTSTKNKLGQQRSRSSSRKQSRGESLKAESPPTKLDAASATTTAKIIRNTHTRDLFIYFFISAVYSVVYIFIIIPIEAAAAMRGKWRHHHPNKSSSRLRSSVKKRRNLLLRVFISKETKYPEASSSTYRLFEVFVIELLLLCVEPRGDSCSLPRRQEGSPDQVLLLVCLKNS